MVVTRVGEFGAKKSIQINLIRLNLSFFSTTYYVLSHFSRVQLFATLWTIAHQAPLSMGFSRQEYWTGLPCPPPGDHPDPEIEPLSLMSPALAGGFFSTSTTWEALNHSLPQLKPLQFSQLSCSLMSDSLRPHESQHARPPCPSPTPRVYSNSYPSSWWCHPAILSSVVPFSSCPQSLPASGSFPMSQLHIRWPNYWSFSFSICPSNEHPGLISFRMDWLDLLAVQGTLKSLLQHHSSKH